MHPVQQSILQILQKRRSLPLQLRGLGRMVGEYHPQKIKYHLQQLERKGFISIDVDNQCLSILDHQLQEGLAIVSLPIMGSANCGQATSFADDRIEGFLKISRALLPIASIEQLFALRAKGDSMNRANISGKSIGDGDFVIVLRSDYQPANGDYVVSIIDECANIKRFFNNGEEIALISESTRDYPPIFIHGNDCYHIVGKVMKVIKTPRLE